jgi:phosphoribosyl 1,2-cyclic phosphodiesterase
MKCWGARGSAPSPGPNTVRFGGHTSCLEVRPPGGRHIVLDAGSGIGPLGRHLAATSTTRELDLFLTHFHWDHIQGLPFFDPLYEEPWSIRVHAEPQHGGGVEELLCMQMRAPYFPVGLKQVGARMEYRHLEGQPWQDGGVNITPFRVRHPNHTSAFRITCDGGTVVYMPDNELEGSGYDVDGSWEGDLVEFVSGADALLHNAMFTEAEYASRRGWGHGTFEQAVALAERAGVPRLLLFHHAPYRTDAELEHIVEGLRRDAAARHSRLEIEAAAEGRELLVTAPHMRT